jgi:hypothetical protein
MDPFEASSLWWLEDRYFRPLSRYPCRASILSTPELMETAVVEKILKHVGLPHKPPDIAPARYAVQQPLFDT